MSKDSSKTKQSKSGDHSSKNVPVQKHDFDMEGWTPKTELGKKVKAGEITDISQIFDKGLIILEPEIVDALIPNLESALIMVGQSKGKFGGGKRSIWKTTQKKTCEGNKAKFTSVAIVGNRNGYIGLGIGKAKETMPAREKAVRQAKRNLIRIKRGCGSWECSCAGPHSIPFKVRGKCGSVIVEIMTAPKGSSLRIEKECQKMLELAGIKDVYSRTSGQTGTKLNLIKACFAALRQLTQIRTQPSHNEKLGIVEGINE